MSEQGATPAFSCAEVDQIAGELGLGVLDGIERAAALAHLEGCPRCRAAVEDAVRVSDHLLELGAKAEPPIGFESRVVARHHATAIRRPRHQRRHWVALGAGLGAAATAAGVFLGLGFSGALGAGAHQPGTVAAAGLSDIRTAPLMSGHQEVGRVFLATGKPSWVFMSVELNVPEQTVTCQLVTTSGRHIDLGSFSLSEEYGGSWGSTVNVMPSSIHGVQLVTASGHVVSHATI
jgi:hypothetical protein